jgi:hypothetical protein
LCEHFFAELTSGCFAALAVATMLNLLTPELVRDLPQYLVKYV